jgi:hypothetical protein
MPPRSRGAHHSRQAFGLVRKADLVLSEDSGLMHMSWVSEFDTRSLRLEPRRLVASSRRALALPRFFRPRVPFLHGSGVPLGERSVSLGLTRRDPQDVAELAIHLMSMTRS